MRWQTARFDLDLSRPRVMGIVNATPDSFYDGGRHAATDAAMRHCDRLVADGADILDIGGESTRPGAATPDLAEELARVMPVIRHAVSLGVPVSVDTSRPEVMQAALDAGADILNDVRALQRPGALAVLAAHPGAGACLMHMQGEPGTMQAQPAYGDVVAEVGDWLAARLAEVVAAGVAPGRVLLDPGIGFGKTPAHNLTLLQHQGAVERRAGRPLLIGWSRKSTLGQVTGRPADQRLAASVAAALAAAQQGAAVLRVHDVAETVDAIKVWQAAGLLTPRMADGAGAAMLAGA